MRPILVTGGTGTLGRQVVARLREADHDVRVLSRRRPSTADEAPDAWATGDLQRNIGIEAPSTASLW